MDGDAPVTGEEAERAAQAAAAMATAGSTGSKLLDSIQVYIALIS